MDRAGIETQVARLRRQTRYQKTNRAAQVQVHSLVFEYQNRHPINQKEIKDVYFTYAQIIGQ